MRKITKGENCITKTILYQDRVAIPLSSFSSVKAHIIQSAQILATYTLGVNPEIRSGANGELIVEIKRSLSNSFSNGEVRMDIDLESSDPQFVVDGLQYRKISLKLFHVSL